MHLLEDRREQTRMLKRGSREQESGLAEKRIWKPRPRRRLKYRSAVVKIMGMRMDTITAITTTHMVMVMNMVLSRLVRLFAMIGQICTSFEALDAWRLPTCFSRCS